MIFRSFSFGLVVASVAGVAGALPAQLTPGHVAVLTRSGSVADVLDVDPATGTFGRLGTAATSGEALAIAWDPVTGGVVVATGQRTPAGYLSLLFRYDVTGSRLGSARALAQIPARVEGLDTRYDGDVVAITSTPQSGIWHVPRLGGTARQVMPFAAGAAATAMWMPEYGDYAWVALSRGALEPQLMLIDLTGATMPMGPYTLPGLAGRTITGVFDLPTGAIRELVTDDLGQLHLFEGLTNVQTIALSPALPPGGAVALRPAFTPASIDGLVLGGPAHPHLIQAPVFGGPIGTWTNVAGPLPGDPIDFDVADPAGPRVVPFGASCTASGPTWTSSGSPQIGTTFTFGVRGATPMATALGVFGVSEQTVLGMPLPLALPAGGCLLHVSTEVVHVTTVNALGTASLAIPIPNSTGLVGARVFAQWVIRTPAQLATTGAAALHVGR